MDPLLISIGIIIGGDRVFESSKNREGFPGILMQSGFLQISGDKGTCGGISPDRRKILSEIPIKELQ
jgi:hypothetical protein